MLRICLSIVATFAGLYTGAIALGEPVAGEDQAIAREVRALLSDKCFACHGPDAGSRAADLRLDTSDGQRAASDHSPSKIVDPGKPAASELWRRVTAADPDLRMPPTESHRQLSEADKQLINRWIVAGAPWTKHWAFVAPKKQELPSDDEWARNTIDRFALSELTSAGLKPAPAATKEEWLRRVTLDLTGIPPTLAELDEFLADETPEAHERVVDRLLASPRFGERMASDWLDLARYADTYGYQADRFRRVWPYRDWVVRAFNDNLPYSEFLTWQLAGDLLPDATQDQVLATAFNRMHRQTNEGGSIPLEFRTENACDRTNTFGAAVLGLTMECARCHDHKFDPISQRDYFQFYAFFNNIDELGLYSHFSDACPTPTLWLDTPEQRAKLASLKQAIESAEQELAITADNAKGGFGEWLASVDRANVTRPDAKVAATFDGEQTGIRLTGGPKKIPGRVGEGILLNGENGLNTNDDLSFDRYDSFSIGIWIKPGERMERSVILHRSAAWLDAAGRGYQIILDNGRPEVALVHFWPGNALAVKAIDAVPIGEWTHIAFTYDGSCRDEGLRLYINGKPAKTETTADCLDRSFKYLPGDGRRDGGLKVSIGNRFRDNGFRNGSVDEFMVYDIELSPVEVATLANAAIDDTSAEDFYPIYLRTACEEYKLASKRLYDLRKTHAQLIDSIPEIMAMREMPKRRETFILRRGAYDAPGDPVEPGLPGEIATDIPLTRNDRLGLANWVTDPRHPLTSRVYVNRLWYLMFGRGIVHPIDNFGSQGSAPTHADLLDWLAVEFVESGWDTKALLKQIVLSSTYRQSSVVSADSRERDPENILLSRGPSYRLPAEMLRDSALAVSGQLVAQMGGPPVKPYQPPGLWKEKGAGGYRRDAGAGSHRRSLYTYWKLTSPHPAMMTFDAADREVCLVQRQSTSTPLQSLVLLNDPQFVEAAVGVADLAWKQETESIDDRLTFVFRSLLARKPSAAELAELKKLYDEELEHFTNDPPAAKSLIEVGDFRPQSGKPNESVAAMAIVALTTMNHHSFVNK